MEAQDRGKDRKKAPNCLELVYILVQANYM